MNHTSKSHSRSTSPAMMETLDNRQMYSFTPTPIASPMINGVCINISDKQSDIKSADGIDGLIARVKALGKGATVATNQVRVFVSFSKQDYESGNPLKSIAKNLQRLWQKGIVTTVCFTPTEVENAEKTAPSPIPGTNPKQYEYLSTADITYDKTVAFFKRLIDNSQYSNIPGVTAGYDIKQYIYQWEIGNEIDLSKYYPQHNVDMTKIHKRSYADRFQDTVKDYVGTYLSGAYDVLHDKNERVVGASTVARKLENAVPNGFSQMMTTTSTFTHNVGGTGTVKTFTDAKYGDFCDVTNIHMYESSAGDAESTLKQVKILNDQNARGNTLTTTEWRLKVNFNQTKHTLTVDQVAEATDKVHTVLQKYNFQSAFYYRIQARAADGYWLVSLYNRDAAPKAYNPFFSMFNRWAKAQLAT